MIGIYKITNPKGKVYIGSSKIIEKRVYYYRSVSSKLQVKIYNSIKKYGWENHVFEVIEQCDFSVLYQRERYYGLLYDVLNPLKGLNLALPLDGEKRIEFSVETRKRMSLAKKGSKNTFYGKTHSIEAKSKIGQSQLGRKHTDEHKAKVSLNNAKPLSKVVYDIYTGVFYDSIKDAAFARNEIHSSLKNRVNGCSPTFTPIKYAYNNLSHKLIT